MIYVLISQKKIKKCVRNLTTIKLIIVYYIVERYIQQLTLNSTKEKGNERVGELPWSMILVAATMGLGVSRGVEN